MTMEQLLESLTKKAKLEAEESHRALVAAINGQAGLDIINQKVGHYHLSYMGAQWLSGRVLDLRSRGCRFEPHWCHCVVSLSKTY